MTRVKYIITMFVIFVFGSMCVNAEGTGIVSVSGNNNLTVGDEVTYNVLASDLKGYDTGIIALQGILTYDSNYFTWIKSDVSVAPIEVQDNSVIAGEYRFAGITLDNGFNGNATIYSITLKAIKEGNTSIKLSDVILDDLMANDLKLVVNNESITINQAKVNETINTESNNESDDETSVPVKKVNSIKNVTTTTNDSTSNDTVVNTTENNEVNNNTETNDTLNNKTNKFNEVIVSIVNFFKNLFTI